jgi:hypothetical protein
MERTVLEITTEGYLTKIRTPNGDVWQFVDGEAQEFISWYCADYRKVNYA